ncbi:MAG: SIS domain-containing protein [Endomicrobium sp.]|jgi:D-sedoheptulose 7-phosphate isomerase|nr:SIS domain-containing protein [Endomicrobium sp.]
MIQNLVSSLINENIKVKKNMLKCEQIECIFNIAEKIVETYKNKNKVIICGNGGSASDALHFSAEMLVKFEKEREPLTVVTLSENVPAITAIGNDLGYDYIFSRQLEAFANKNDIFIAISTSGNSLNVIRALESAKNLKLFKIGMTGFVGGELKNMCDICYCAPSKITARIQECHILVIHIVAKIIEEELFGYRL